MNLTNEQKICLSKTPFAWMMKLECNLKMTRDLLKELCGRWDETRGGFLVNSEFVSLSLLDVCLGLGLRIRGTRVDLTSQPLHSPTRSLFGPNTVSMKMLYEKLIKGENLGSIEEFCRLYILLGMSEFLFPNTKGTVCPGLFSIVDNLDDLCKYNWGSAVLEYLVKSMCRVSNSIRSGSCSSSWLGGCAYLLQIWALEHLLYPNVNIIRKDLGDLYFPRILYQQSVSSIGYNALQDGLYINHVIGELAVTTEELHVDFVREAFPRAAAGAPAKKEKEHTEQKMQYMTLLKQKSEWDEDLKDLRAEIASREQLVKSAQNEVAYLARQRQQSHGTQQSEVGDCSGNVPCPEPIVVDPSPQCRVVGDERLPLSEADCQQPEAPRSNIYTRVKQQPRKRPSASYLKSPWTTYQRRKRKAG